MAFTSSRGSAPSVAAATSTTADWSLQQNSNLLLKIWFCPTEERSAKELIRLEPEQREKVWADLSGNPETTHYRMTTAETPQRVAQQLKEMNIEIEVLLKNGGGAAGGGAAAAGASSSAAATAQPLSPLPFSNPAGGGQHQQNEPKYLAYRLAMEADAAYVNAQKLAFLRAEDFVPKQAAIRILSYFNMKRQLFDSKCLARNILLKDLSKDDLESLEAGGVQILSMTDHAGRGIVVTRQANYRYKTHENMLRAFFYCGQTLLLNENYQKLGLVSISYQVGGYPGVDIDMDNPSDIGGEDATSQQHKQRHQHQQRPSHNNNNNNNSPSYDFELLRKVSNLIRVMPMRFVAIYLCYSLTSWTRVADLISHMVSPFLRVRLRSVQGSHQECMHQLMVLTRMPRLYDVFPVQEVYDGAGGVGGLRSDLTHHHQWIAERRRLECGTASANGGDFNGSERKQPKQRKLKTNRVSGHHNNGARVPMENGGKNIIADEDDNDGDVVMADDR